MEHKAMKYLFFYVVDPQQVTHHFAALVDNRS